MREVPGTMAGQHVAAAGTKISRSSVGGSGTRWNFFAPGPQRAGTTGGGWVKGSGRLLVGQEGGVAADFVAQKQLRPQRPGVAADCGGFGGLSGPWPQRHKPPDLANG